MSDGVHSYPGKYLVLCEGFYPVSFIRYGVNGQHISLEIIVGFFNSTSAVAFLPSSTPSFFTFGLYKTIAESFPLLPQM